MNRNLSKKIILGTIILLSFLVIRPIFAYNFVKDSGLGVSANTAGYATTGTPSVEALIGSVILALLSFVGVIFLVFIIYGAITWMTAEGSEEKVKKAKTIIHRDQAKFLDSLIFFLQTECPVILRRVRRDSYIEGK